MPRPDALIPALDEDQLAAVRQVGREWDRVSADPQAWRQALQVDPSLGEYPEAGEVRPGRFTRFVPVTGRDGQLPPIQTTSVSETPPTPHVQLAQVFGWCDGAMAELDAAYPVSERTGPPAGRYANELFTEGASAVTVYRPVRDPHPYGRIEVVNLPGTELAIAVHSGPHDEIDVTCGRLGAWVV
jgi:hypothetical protein